MRILVCFERALITGLCIGLLSCASLPGRDPPEVSIAGMEPLQGQGLEMRFLLKLRVQNPNDSPIDYDGVSVQLNMQGKKFATGVSDATGNVPRYGESIISVPLTIPAFQVARQVIGMTSQPATGKFRYELKGKLSAPGLGSTHFSNQGELDMPQGVYSPATD
ncbi:MAG: LEA type 2 family protein [Povalibacter sp.]